MAKKLKYQGKKLKILGKPTPIKYVDIFNLGEWDARSNAIHLSKHHKYETKDGEDETLVHELVHAVCSRIGVSLDGNVEEVLAETISITVCENFTLKLK